MSWKQLASREQSTICDNYGSVTVMSLFDPMDCSTSGVPVLHCFPEFTQTHDNWVMPSNHLILCHPSSPALNLSQHQGLLQCIGSSHQAAYWSFSFSISPSSEYSGSAAFWIKSFSLPQHLGSQIHSVAYHVESRANSDLVTRGYLLEFCPSLFWLQNHKMTPEAVEVISGKYQHHLSLNDCLQWSFTLN